ncbi:MAG: methionine--tRNA ligase [Candidatus Harrisonbacteria bacterium]|nr:methionine--tRNA ligase [Candidatus Harrisonbacteria bacterium]
MNKFYITTSIAYVNAPPHIGFALESLQADVLARSQRQLGNEAFFLTGTDEHGAKIARAAAAAGKTPKRLVDENAERFRELKTALNLSWDNFIRTSDSRVHWPVAQELWSRLTASGDLYRKSYKGLYCVGHEAFVTEKDLENGICRDHKKAPEVIEEENWFFKLSKYTKEIELRIRNDELRIVPESRKNEILSFLAEGLEDVSFSRPSKDLSWGIPVPGDDTQTMYVWADALSNYISGYGGIKKWEEYPADVHLIGKDILRFHAAIWPGMLLSAKLLLPKSIYVHGHILVGGEKMSKTVGNVVDPFGLVQKYGTEAVRYFLLREIPSTDDGDFTYEKFEERYNGDLANGLGNFAARVLTLAERDAKLQISSKSTNVDNDVDRKIKETKESVALKIEEFKLHEALEALWGLIHFGDRYVNEKKPWAKGSAESDRRRAVYNALVILDNVAALLLPFLPETAGKISNSISWSGNNLSVKKIEALFPRID